MNTLKIAIISIMVCLATAEHTSAQFLRELRDRAIDRSKDMIINKTADKAAEKTAGAMDKLLNPDLSKLMNPSGKKIDMDNLPDAYHFSYLYRLKMSTQSGEIEFDYYLNPDMPYMGSKMNIGMDMTMVFDEGNKAIITVMNGMPIATEMEMNEGFNEEDLKYVKEYTITELPNREFLGYDCIGRLMENEDYKFTVYIAPNVESGFGNVFKSDRANMPPAMQAAAQEYENGLMMYMEMEDKKNKRNKSTSGIMECVAFESKETVIRIK